MQEATFATLTESIRRHVVWRALGALIIGASLGVLVALPYDRWMSLSMSACTVLQALAATAVLTGLGTRRSIEFTDAVGSAALADPGTFLVG